MASKEALPMRQSNMELLRIIAMLGIIAYNALAYGGISYDVPTISLQRLFWVECISSWGKIGVNLFVLGSGYFLTTARNLNVRKGLSLWVQMLICSLGVTLVSALAGSGVTKGTQIGITEALRPVSAQIWWFASTYFVLLMLTPCLNAMMDVLGRGRAKRMLVTMGAIWCLFPNVLGGAWPGGDLAWFVFVYLVASYIRRYDCLQSTKHHDWAWIPVGLLFVLLIAVTASFVATRQDMFAPLGLSDMIIAGSESNIMVFAASMCLFAGFMSIDMGSNKIINLIASTTFGIYLIHDHPWVRRWLWQGLVGGIDVTEMPVRHMLPIVLGVVLAVFCVCGLMDLLRQVTIARWLDRPLGVASDCIEQWMRRVLPVDAGDGADRRRKVA